MFAVVWAAVALLNGEPIGHSVMQEQAVYPDRAACEHSIAEHKDRVGDYMRGHLGVDWTVEFVVTGRCEPQGDPV